ncbi:hypothetical protein PVK06_036863 [Gossypium arboreum]|uniref:Uncharacterized protein n=1 Tax=Gossypium arboreum TaxID=29729 RepID=A0ABR0NKQ3_GOSAR|nr:hypothetical protein PVK06_036863 [Gossypium arboreum]
METSFSFGNRSQQRGRDSDGRLQASGVRGMEGRMSLTHGERNHMHFGNLAFLER